MIIVNEIQDPRYIEVSAKAIDAYFKKKRQEVGISNGVVVSSGIEYVYGVFVCQVYPENEPEDSEVCDLMLVHTRIHDFNEVEVAVSDGPFF